METQENTKSLSEKKIEKNSASPGSWFSFVLGMIVAGIGAAISPVAPGAGQALIGTGLGLIGTGISQSANEELNNSDSVKKPNEETSQRREK